MTTEIEPIKVDEKGRKAVLDMTTEECARESLAIARATQDLVEKFLMDFQAGKIGGPLGILGKFMK